MNEENDVDDKIKLMGTFPLLTAKLFPPPYQSELVPRTRLTKKLDSGIHSGRKYTLVSAPAGFGKTTLVVQWLEAHKRAQLEAEEDALSFGWFSIDTSDNDLNVFLHYLLAALQSAVPGVGRSMRESLESGQALSYETLLLPLLNELFLIQTPFMLVLDDYHVIQDPSIHQAVMFLLERQPPSMHTILITRQDPLLPLARWRARGQITDVRLGELRFSDSETTEFLTQLFGLQLEAADIAALEARTEGWIAGLQMAAISIKQAESESDNVSDFIRAFEGDDRFIMDYLLDEVLNKQPDIIQDFLLKTSVLDRFNSPLCAAVLGETEPAKIIEVQRHLTYLEESNLFLIPLDHRRQWYRYHHLFADLLKNRLVLTYGSAYTADCQRRASLWYDANGFPEQAIQYAQAAGDWKLAGKLINDCSSQLILQSEMMALIRHIRSLPETVLRQDPLLCQKYGYSLTQCGQLITGKTYLDLSEQGLQDNPESLGATLIFSSFNALFRGEFSEQIAKAQHGLELLPGDNTWIHASGYLSLGIGLLHSRQPQSAEIACQKALTAGLNSGSVRSCITALSQMGRTAVLRLDFVQAEERYRRALEMKVNEKIFPSNDLALFDLAMLKYEQNELDLADELVEMGLEANSRSGSIEMLAYGYRIKARLKQLRGNAQESQEYLQQALQLSMTHDLSPLTLVLNAALQVQMAVYDGNLREGDKIAAQVTQSDGVYPFIFYPEIYRVQLLLVQDRKDDALQLLQPVLEQVQEPGWEYPRLQVRSLQALAESSAVKAKQTLIEALSLAQKKGAVRAFLDLGEPMRLLLASSELGLEDPGLKNFVRELLAAFPGGASQKHSPQEQGLIEPLSEREIEVLRLLADGLSNAEIAQRLYLSPNTLKAHTQNIYSKLEVHSRLQATNRARELNII